jgi:hypothetical protein
MGQTQANRMLAALGEMEEPAEKANEANRGRGV